MCTCKLVICFGRQTHDFFERFQAVCDNHFPSTSAVRFFFQSDHHHIRTILLHPPPQYKKLLQESSNSDAKKVNNFLYFSAVQTANIKNKSHMEPEEYKKSSAFYTFFLRVRWGGYSEFQNCRVGGL